jgi:hypothetical protein
MGSVEFCCRAVLGEWFRAYHGHPGQLVQGTNWSRIDRTVQNSPEGAITSKWSWTLQTTNSGKIPRKGKYDS